MSYSQSVRSAQAKHAAMASAQAARYLQKGGVDTSASLPAPAPRQVAEVTGIVTEVRNTYGDRSAAGMFTIHTPNQKKDWQCTCPFFCPVQEGDAIHALCSVVGPGVLEIVRPPFVQIPCDRVSLKRCFTRVFRGAGFGDMKAGRLVDALAAAAGGEGAIAAYLSALAQEWTDGGGSADVLIGGGLTPHQARRLLIWWHRKRDIRRLHLLGLTNKEIEACAINPGALYERVVSNPYSLPPIPIEKCEDILARQNRKADPADIECGHVVRGMWRNLVERGWTATPTRRLVTEFPAFLGHVSRLMTDYGVISELDSAYLTRPARVERDVAAFIVDTLSRPPRADEWRASPNLTRDLSDDQVAAVRGALSSPFSVITGGAGTGKCLDPLTPVLMFSGAVKPAGLVAPDELLMGPDSRPRRVLGVTAGTDSMFAVRPAAGRPFVCNEPHVLTLRGPHPRAPAQPRAVFDVPLSEFLGWPAAVRAQCRLMHAEVDFPAAETPRDPAEFGFWLGKGGQPAGRIPAVFLVNSRDVRAGLLAGLADAAGESAPGRPGAILLRLPPPLAEGAEFAALSLGCMAAPAPEGVVIWGGPGLPGGRLGADPEAVYQPFTVEALGEGVYSGFELDGDGRFLLGDFLVTHNTTVINELAHNLELQGIPYVLCSFTGKAVARLRQVTKRRSPSTIHRLIMATKRSGKEKQDDETATTRGACPYLHVIIDEASMVTCELFADFLSAYPAGDEPYYVTLVGDASQLPPIGWGTLFSECIRSRTVPTFVLTTNHRVYPVPGETDGILANANEIVNHDADYPFDFVETSNFVFVDGGVERVCELIRAFYAQAIRPDQITILSPYNRELDVLNGAFQQIYNEGQPSVTDSRGKTWMLGDRVIMLENDYEINVMNGEQGYIRHIGPKAITIDFGDSGCHEFFLEPTGKKRRSDEDDIPAERTVLLLALAYALSIHKSQGSEFDHVIIYIPMGSKGSFLNKNLIYTAITRARRSVWNVGDTYALQEAAVRPQPWRCEHLAKRLAMVLPALAIEGRVDDDYPEWEPEY